MGKEQLAELEANGFYLSVPQGISMLPMLKGGRDIAKVVRLTSEPKRYDLVMYLRGDSQGVIHRVIGKKDGDYVIVGDNCWYKEYVRPGQIAGIVTEFCRRGKWHTVDEKGYRAYVRIWVFLFPVRRAFIYVREKLRPLARKVRRKLTVKRS